MASQWSPADSTRRRLFLVAMAAVLAILVWIGYQFLTAGSEPAATRGTAPPTNVARTAQPSPGITVPPGHDDGDDATPPPPARSQQPIQIPPRYDQPPTGPLAPADLKAASDRAFGFMEVFANGRWDDKPDDKINALRPFVAAASLDVVLAQYERIRAKPGAHEGVTFRVTAATWWSLSDRQATLLVSGERRVVDDSGDHTAARAFVVTLVRAGSAWSVTSVRDPDEGDVGTGTR